MTHTITINPDGSLQFIYDDDLAPLLSIGQATTRRASHVEPAASEGWTADMSPVQSGVVLGPFRLRSEALAAERALLAERGF